MANVTGTVMRVRTYAARERFAARALAVRVASTVPQEAGSADRTRATHTTGSHSAGAQFVDVAEHRAYGLLN
jgi:hypothetical protein